VSFLDLLAELDAPAPHPLLVAAMEPAPAEVMEAAKALGGLYPDVPYLGTLK
jgi:hypothetical protein